MPTITVSKEVKKLLDGKKTYITPSYSAIIKYYVGE
jgi:hypothetical protein